MKLQEDSQTRRKRIDFAKFIDKYFYVDGSFSAGYAAFLDSMIKPFGNTVKILMENIITGDLQDPLEAFLEEEERKLKKEKAREAAKQREKERSQKSYGESLKALRQMLLEDKTKVNKLKNEDLKKELSLVIDTFGSALESNDKDALLYSYTAYKYMVKAKFLFFFLRYFKVNKYFKELINAI